MAQPSFILNEARSEVTQLVRHLHDVDRIVHLIEDVGGTDQERVAFFAQYIDALEAYDITKDEFFAAVVALRDLQSWLAVSRPVLAKLKR